MWVLTSGEGSDEEGCEEGERDEGEGREEREKKGMTEMDVEWEHNETLVSISAPRGGVNIHTEAGGSLVKSRLSVVRAAPPDAGNYTCRPQAALPASASVYIVDEQFPAAMHHESATNLTTTPWQLLLILAALVAAR
ncbi:hypothetical protein Pcinc_005306 [Petrolisthes cinctipes]|uniref:Uncharacterized protein n=1 Tax=Petrolisthes cinctipes TaxID=88211 RepID=A0AAE1GDN4_PETCI|nr:hypothetical protein Pcinc_005306 [Petrolisthes cinctipes]